ncbi:MAG: serine hydrolase domain-containing protein [Sandaracinaceae bacterium]
MDELVATGGCPGYAFLLARDGEILETGAGGYADVATQRPMTATTPVRIASMTKPVTAFAVLQLVERGVLRLDQPASDFIPALAHARVAVSTMAGDDGTLPTEPLARPITIHDLLTHTAGIGYFFGEESDLQQRHVELDPYRRDIGLEVFADELAAIPLHAQPGRHWRYSWANDVLGRVVEVASEQPLDAYLAEHIFRPLRMHDTGFPLGAGLPADLATVYVHDEDGALLPSQGLDLAEATWPSGGGGLISTAADFMRFALMLAQEGELEGVRLLSAEGVRLMRSDQLADAQRPSSGEGFFFDAGYGYGVGIALDAFPEWNRRIGALPGDFGWAGAYDTLFRVGPTTGLVAVFVTQVEPGPHLPERNEVVFGQQLPTVLGD